MRAAFAVLLLAFAPIAGCLEGDGDVPPPSVSEAQHRLHGAFTAEASQTDLQEVDAQVRSRGGDVAILESFPMQFVVTGVGLADCEALRAWFANRTYVASVDACMPVTQAADPEEPVSNEPDTSEPGAGDQPIMRSVHGRFHENATGDDFTNLTAEIEALGGTLAILKSYPAQYTANHLTSTTCPQARAILEGKPFVATVGECEIVVVGEGANDTLDE